MNQSSVVSFTKQAPEALLKNLLVAYDSSEASESALQYAIAIAQTFGSFITVVSAKSPSELADEMETGIGRRKESRRQLTEDLQSIAERLNGYGIRNRVIYRAGAIADVLVQLAAVCEAELLFMGAYGHTRMDRPRLGSTAEFMLRSMPCAVLTVGPGAILHDASAPPLRTLLCASSLPARTGRARRIMQTLAQKFGTHVEIVHVVDDESKAIDIRTRAEMRAAEEALTSDLRRAGIDATWKLLSGPIGARILERSSEIHADLIVFGLEHVPAKPDTIGAISATIWQAQCPVLTVPGPA